MISARPDHHVRHVRRIGSVALLFFCCHCLVANANEPLRIWVDAHGIHTVEARLIKNEGDHAVLLRRDGGVTRIAITMLSALDQQYLQQYELRAQSASRPMRLSPPQQRQIARSPILKLPAAKTIAADGSNLQLAAADAYQEKWSLPGSLEPDRSPWSGRSTTARIPIRRIDVHDTCSRAIPFRRPGNKSGNGTLLAMSMSQGIPRPGAATRSALAVLDPLAETMKIVRFGNEAMRLLDHHDSSQRGLVLVGHDAMGRGGRLAIARGWTEEKIELIHPRQVSPESKNDSSPHVRWARWVDDENFVALIDQTIGMWNITSGEQVYRMGGIDTRAEPCISGGRRYVAVPIAGAVELRRTADGVTLGRIPVETNQVAGVSFSPQGDSLAIVTSRRLRVWDLPRASLSSDVQCRHTLGKRSPVWIDHDLVLTSSGVLVSSSRGLPIWRYNITGSSCTSVGSHVAVFRKHPVTELSVVSIPHVGARQALRWLDDNDVIIDTDNWSLPGRSDWVDGQWNDRDVKLSLGASPLR